MVEWTEFERATIQDIFSKMDYESVGHNALARYVSANYLQIILRQINDFLCN